MKPDKTAELIALVRRLRDSQRRSTASPTNKQYQSETRDLERRVDRLLDGIRQPTLFTPEGGAA